MQRSSRMKKRYIHGFDGLRALAVIAVILYHLNPDVFKGGYLGVPIFMVLSGYLITDHMLLSLSTTGHFSFKDFWLRRIKRLYPALLAMLLTTSAYIVLFQRNLLGNLHKIVISNIFYVYNWWQIANGQSYFERFANSESPFTHLWTLSIEGQFYLIWPLIILLLWRLTKKRKITIFWTSLALAVVSSVLMALLYQPSVDPSRVYYGTDTRAFSILFGCMLAVIWPSSYLKKNVLKSDRFIMDGIGLLSFAGMIWLMFSLNAQADLLYRGGMVLFTLFTVLIVAVVAHPGSDWDRILTNPVFNWIGSRSYGLYLYQFPVMIFFESKFRNIADHPILYPVLEVLIIVAISEFFYRFVEKPLGHFDYHQTITWFKQLFQAKSGSRMNLQRGLTALFTLVTVVGLVGIFQAPTVNADAANHSQLATTIKKNAKKTDKENKRIAAEMRSQREESKKAASNASLSKSISKSSSISNANAEAEAAKNPVNQDLEKYGLTQVELHAAQNLMITGIGDSVMLGSVEGYQRIFPKMYLSASVSEQVYQIMPRIKSILDQGLMAQTVVIGLGTNGSFQDSDLDQIMTMLGSSRQVFWINVHVPTRSWQNQVNSDLVNGAKRHANLHIIDWYNYSKGHPDWFSGDNVHPNPSGSPYYYTFVAKQILDTLAAK